MSRNSISVVIPNYNGVNLLQENLPYVYRALSTSGIADFEIIVPDDASVDNSVEFLRTNFPDIIVVQNIENRGFAGNINSGIRATKKDLVLALNSDVQLTDNYFVSQMQYFERDDTFGVMGRIMSMTGDKIQAGANYSAYSFADIGSIRNYICPTRTFLYTLFLSGANALMDREKLMQLGCFCELFNPYYREDVDLGLTAWERGYKLYYEHNAVCRHPNSATIKKEPSSKVQVVVTRNKILLHYRHLTGFECGCFMAKTMLKVVGRMLIGNMRYYKAWRQFYAIRQELALSKKHLQVGKKQSLKQTVALIKADVKNDDVEMLF
ncbi:hypothetical protein FACS189452_01540 [Bacteroidia bacterium]|nr:hypothetical protein FACS189452_01540 [Bacteroidia bacterium]